MLTTDELNQLRALIREEVEPVKKAVEAVDKKLDKAQTELAETLADILEVVGEHHDKLEKRVEWLEKAAGVTQPQ
jgi:hypothetical protein